jgi:uncharacterized protein YjiS (DUF1127 family)
MSLTESFRRWRQYRIACTDLEQMTSRELADLGLTRRDIPVVARTAVQ